MALSSYFNKLFGDPSSHPPAATDEDISALLQATAYESVAFKHQFPPRFPILGRTYFGGLPTTPEDFRWPRAPGGTPLTFMAQVDCSELPDFKHRKFLPGSGVLHFFVNWEVFDGLEEAQNWPSHVVFSRGTAESWREAQQPGDLPPCYGASSAGYHFSWLEHTLGTRAYPRAFARKAMTMGVVRNFPEEYPPELDGKSAVRYQEIQEEEQAAELARFYGDPVTADELMFPFYRYKSRNALVDQLTGLLKMLCQSQDLPDVGVDWRIRKPNFEHLLDSSPKRAGFLRSKKRSTCCTTTNCMTGGCA